MSTDIKDFLDAQTLQAVKEYPCLHEWNQVWDLGNGRHVGYLCYHCKFELSIKQYELLENGEKNE